MVFDGAFKSLLDVGGSIIERVWPDPAKQAEEKRKLLELAQTGDLAKLQAQVELLSGQIEINKIDANSKSKFQAWWRPAIGWVGVVSLFMMYVPKAIVMTYIWTVQAVTILNGWDGVSQLNIPPFPDLGVSDIIGLLMALLGVAGMRSFDKLKGTDSGKIK